MKRKKKEGKIKRITWERGTKYRQYRLRTSDTLGLKRTSVAAVLGCECSPWQEA